MNWRKLLLLLANVVLTGLPSAVVGQANLDPRQLPKTTMVYLAWHGTPSGEARKANSLLALWDDADFAPVRAGIIEQMLQGSSASKPPKTPLTQEELTEITSLLDNEFVVGYLNDPNPAKTNSTSMENKMHKWEGSFLVYDRSGKEATLAKLMLRARMSETEPPKISTTTLAGIPALKVERKSGTSYWAEDGKYAYSATEPAVFEQIAAWAKHAAPEVAWLAKTPAYKEASQSLKGGVVEFFFHVPSVKDLSTDASPGGFRLRPLLQNLKIDSVHCIAGQLSIDGPRTRLKGAVLGDASPATPFDIWGEGLTAPASLQFVDESVISYQLSQISLAGIYESIKRALKSTSGAGQQGPTDFIEMAAQSRLGMSLPDALGLFSGEFAAMQADAGLDPARQVYVAGIRKKPETLKLLRAALAERVSAERSDGDTTFYKVSEGGLQSGAGTAAWKYYHVAVTPDAILVSGRNESLRQTLARRKGASAASLQAPPAWQSARGQFPATVNGFSFLDFQKVDWSAIKERWNTETRKSSTATEAKPHSGKFTQVTQNLDPQVFPRHLHLSAGASWKDAQGLHFDGWIE